jgi:MHS family citrate/tricarballylate:H+ symporter-like MFS transporter
MTRRESKVWPVIRVASGNMLEMYDFMIFGYYATAIGRAFFPSGSEFASLMKSLMTFGAGYLMRPLGAIVLGAYIDQHGRRKGLLFTLSLMAFGTLSIAAMPTYQTIGWMAPALVLLGRLVQGFSAGVELGGVSVYLAEIATPGRKGFFSAFQSASQQVAVMLAAVVGITLGGYGWRVPLLVGCAIIPFLFLLRRSLNETEEFLARKRRPGPREILSTLFAHGDIVLLGMMLSTMTTVCFYLITAYTPTFGATVLHLESSGVQWVILCVGASNFFWLPVMGAVSDRVGRKPILFAFAALTILTAYPALAWLVSAPSVLRLLTVQLWFSFMFGSYNGAMIPYLIEIMPAKVRTSGFSVAFSLAAGIFGGFTPALCTYLIEVTGNRAIPGLWLSVAAALGLIATALTNSMKEHDDEPNALSTADSDRAVRLGAKPV